MNWSRRLRATAMTVAFALGLLGGLAGPAQGEQEYVTEAKEKALHQAPLPGVEGKEVIIKHFAFPPGFVGGRHYHPGPVYVYVLQGALTVETAEGAKTYKAGELYPEPLNSPMQAKNLSASDGLEVVVFQVGDTGKPMMIKAD